MSAPTPDLKPRVRPPAPGSECCDCCDGVDASTPLGIFNRHGLSTIAYRVGDYAHFRESLHAALSVSKFAALSGLRARDEQDFTIGLIDAFACAADVVTFYQERIANESWLRTAAERVSLQELGKLVGYRLRPGVAAETLLAFAMDVPPTPPATLAPNPGNFVTGVPAALTLPVGLQVASVPGPGEKPQTFELVETLADARPAWNAIRPWFAEAHLPREGEREVWLEGTATSLKPGDALLFAGNGLLSGVDVDNWNLRIVSGVELDSDANRTRVTFGRALDAALAAAKPATAVFALRKRSAVFGSNAPIWRSMDSRFRSGYAAKFGGSFDQGEWQDYNISGLAASAGGGTVDLDQVQAEIAGDVPSDPTRRSFVVLAKGAFSAPDGSLPADAALRVYRITATTEVSRAEFALSSKVSRLTLSGKDLDTQFFPFVRETSVYARSELLPLAKRPVTTPVSGVLIPATVPADGLLAGRKLIVRGTRASDRKPIAVEAVLAAVHAVDAATTNLEIATPLATALIRDTVVVHANVALASHGESVTQILGAGNAGSAFQRFELKQLPLTYRAARNELGAAAELTVRVADVAWSERPTLFGAAPTDHAYTLETDEQGRLFVQFGDGLRGARLPSGVSNVRARYRKGLGLDGNVAADSLTQLMTRPLGLKSVGNPIAAEGGTDPEPAGAARATIPLTTRTLGRAVSVLDYEDFARAFSGIAKAQAAVLQLRGGPGVAITLAAPNNAALAATNPVRENLLDALKSSGDPHVAVTLLSRQASSFRIGIKVKVDPAYESDKVLAAVEAALRGHFSFDQRELGQPVQQSEVIAVAQSVPGVVAVDLTRLYGGTRPFQQTLPSLQVRLLASRMRVEAGVAKPAEILTIDAAPFDLLGEMP